MNTLSGDIADESMARCYGCFRPRAMCFCAAIPRIANRTDVVILQHVRERFHPFNTARIVDRALARSRLSVTQPTEYAALRLPDAASTGILSLDPRARPLAELATTERPTQLVVLDGAWSHARTMLRNIPALDGLPRYRLSPAAPGNYRLRREPTPASLSTLEATVAALRILEPETAGFADLLAAFDKMVDDQLAHPNSHRAWRRKRKRRRSGRAIPPELAAAPENLVVAYGEAAAEQPGQHRQPRRPLVWYAERLGAGQLGTGQRFAAAISPADPLDETLREHLRLPAEFFRGAYTAAEFADRWSEFFRPSDTLVVYHKNTLAMLRTMSPVERPVLVLKSICGNLGVRYASPDDLPRGPRRPDSPVPMPGRAGERLAGTIALLEWLQAKMSCTI